MPEDEQVLECTEACSTLIDSVSDRSGYAPAYGDLAAHNSVRLILDSVGPDLLSEIVGSYMDHLQTSGAVYEANGDYALGIFSSGWCRYLDQASRALCHTDDNRAALDGGQWLCHEACWRGARKALEEGRPVDITCPGGVKIYSVPIVAGDQTVGAANFGYGNPPRDDEALRKIAKLYRVDDDILKDIAEECPLNSPLQIEMAKSCLKTAAKLIGTIVKQKMDQAFFDRKEAEWEKIFQATGQPIFILDPNYHILNANKAAVEAAAGIGGELLGRRCFEIFHREKQPPDKCPASNLLKTDTANVAEMKVEALDRYFLVSCTALRNVAGKIEKIIHVATDITERRAAEEKLRISEFRLQHHMELLQTIMDNMPLMIALIEANGRIRWVNRAWEKITGYSLAQAQQPDIWNKLYPDPGYLAMVMDFVKRADGKWGNFKTHTRGNKVIDAVWTNVTLSDGTNIGIGEDVTELRRAENEQEKLAAQLIQAQKMESIGRLAGGMAHDFNNLLSIVLGYSELLLLDLPQDHPHLESLQEINSAGVRAQSLVRHLLTFARKQVLAIKQVDLSQVVRGFEKMLRRLIGEDIRLEINLSADPLIVNADVAQLEQVLLNLAVNARDAMPDGGELSITTRSEVLGEAFLAGDPGVRSGSYACMEVKDTGSGMDADTQANIFDPFFTTKPKDKGTGLGLSTVYGIIKQHQGHIRVESRIERGTTFRIYLPDLLTEPLEEQHASTQTDDCAEDVNPSTILVVEDDPTVRLLVVKVLTKAGFTVLEPRDIRDALTLVERYTEAIHLALVDVVMPEMRGPALFERIRSHHPETKVLYMSGYAENEVSHQGQLQAGINFISKPFVVQELLQRVKQILNL